MKGEITTSMPMISNIIEDTKKQVINFKNPKVLNPISRIHLKFKRDQIAKAAIIEATEAVAHALKEAVKIEVDIQLDTHRKTIMSQHARHSLKLMDELNKTIDIFAKSLTEMWLRFEVELSKTSGKVLKEYNEMLNRGEISQQRYDKQIERSDKILDQVMESHEERYNLMIKDHIAHLREAIKTFSKI